MQFLVATTLILLAHSRPATLCTCSPPNQRSAYRAAGAIFVGRVIEIDENAAIPDRWKDQVFFAIKFEVERSWKGPRKTEITILSDQGWYSCGRGGAKFKQGERYLVYALGKELIDVGCSRGGRLSDSSNDIKRLDSSFYRMSVRVIPF